MKILEMDFSEIERRALANLSTEELAEMRAGNRLRHGFNYSGTVTGRFFINLPACEDIPRKSNIPKEE